ncbi:cell division protein DivIC [Paenibacillus polymyxa]|uniref:FtsB family cell division protein n=1 Tax=Paenibacillus polymyxa TaxID=1406 RepID=UPI0027941F5D|nr:septum formation initiator family protein [Paenibacillus polymyxa]MDQ0050778.1 cell division protein DivIC [Paenibacillus polymyxa]
MRNSSVDRHSSSTSKSNAGGRRRIMIWLLSLAAFGSWAIFTFFSQGMIMADRNEQLIQKEKQKQAATQTERQLQTEVNRLKDPEYIGEIARSKYGLYKPEETPIIGDQK